MTQQQNTALALQLLDAIVAGDIAGVRERLCPSARWEIPGFGDYGREDFLLSLQHTFDLSSTRRLHVRNTTAEANRVAVEVAGEFHFHDGRDYNNRYHYLFEFDNGLIVRACEYMDTALARAIFAPGGSST